MGLPKYTQKYISATMYTNKCNSMFIMRQNESILQSINSNSSSN